MAFWFSLVKSNDVKDKNLLSFNRILADDDDLRVVFLLFYVAILYHVALLMKAQSPALDLPASVTFSGTGSKLINILTADNAALRELSQLVFERVLDKPYPAHTSLTVYTDPDQPKEATCKGALMMSVADQQAQPKSVVFMGTADALAEPLTYGDLAKPDVAETLINDATAFFAFFFALNRDFDFQDNLNVSAYALKTAREQLNLNLMDYLKTGIQKKVEDQQGDDAGQDKKVEEPLFFYPLIGAINRLVSTIGAKTN